MRPDVNPRLHIIIQGFQLNLRLLSHLLYKQAYPAQQHGELSCGSIHSQHNLEASPTQHLLIQSDAVPSVGASRGAEAGNATG